MDWVGWVWVPACGAAVGTRSEPRRLVLVGRGRVRTLVATGRVRTLQGWGRVRTLLGEGRVRTLLGEGRVRTLQCWGRMRTLVSEGRVRTLLEAGRVRTLVGEERVRTVRTLVGSGYVRAVHHGPIVVYNGRIAVHHGLQLVRIRCEYSRYISYCRNPPKTLLMNRMSWDQAVVLNVRHAVAVWAANLGP